MKTKERKVARRLRSKGWSVRAIARKINCAKGSVSAWVRDISLTPKQIQCLKSNQQKGREKAVNHPNSPKNKWARIRQESISQAKKEIPRIYTSVNLKVTGAALYWAEGYTASRNMFVFANSDAGMIRLMLRFLKEICHVPFDKLRGRVNIHPHLDIEAAHRYWQSVSGIPKKQFHRPLLAVSRASKQKRDSLPMGTFRIIISDVYLCSRIKGYIEGLKSWAVSSAG